MMPSTLATFTGLGSRSPSDLTGLCIRDTGSGSMPSPRRLRLFEQRGALVTPSSAHTRWRGGVKSRLLAHGRDAKIAGVGIVVLVAGAVGVRTWLMVSYSPAFLGFPDSTQYVVAAATGIFSNLQHPAGYPIFLRLLQYLNSNLSFTIAAQHAMGIATGLLLYKSVRRTGGPPWLGLLPAAIVFFGGTGLILEHSLLADPAACLSAGRWCLLRDTRAL